MERKGFLNVGEIAAKMGVSEATVWGLIKRREVGPLQVPRRPPHLYLGRSGWRAHGA